MYLWQKVTVVTFWKSLGSLHSTFRGRSSNISLFIAFRGISKHNSSLEVLEYRCTSEHTILRSLNGPKLRGQVLSSAFFRPLILCL